MALNIVNPYRPSVWPFPDHPVYNNERIKFKTGARVDFLDPPHFLGMFVKQYQTKRGISNYSLFYHSAPRGHKRYGSGNFQGNFYADTGWQFVLTNRTDRHDQYAAVLGMEFVNSKSLLLTQVQGVRGMKRPLSKLKWPNALVNLALQWAWSMEISEVCILPSDRNNWPSVRLAGSVKRMFYDFTAKREGFNFDVDKQVYVKSLDDKL